MSNPRIVEIVEVLSTLGAVYPTSKMDEANYLAYARMLCDIEPEALAWACHVWARRHKWFPAVSELCELLAELALAAAGCAPSAEEAWAMVASSLNAGLYPELSDPIAAALVPEKEWRRLGQVQIPMLVSERKAFLAAYNAQRARRVTQHQLEPGAGCRGLALPTATVLALEGAQP